MFVCIHMNVYEYGTVHADMHVFSVCLYICMYVCR